MPFVMTNSKVLNERDSNNLKKMLNEILNGYLESIREDAQYSKRDQGSLLSFLISCIIPEQYDKIIAYSNIDQP